MNFYKDKKIFLILIAILVILAPLINDYLEKRFARIGVASWYGKGLKGKLTANGEKYSPDKFTAAHRFLPFDTKVKVTNLENNRSVTVRINDRGPYILGRIIDLSIAAARRLKMKKKGLAKVELEILDD